MGRRELRWSDPPRGEEVPPDASAILLTKQIDGHARVYRADIRFASLAGKPSVQAEFLGTLPLPVATTTTGSALRATAADLTSDGQWLAVRTSLSVRLFDDASRLGGPADATLVAQIAAWRGLMLPAPPELQGESVTWDGARAVVGERG